MGKQYYKALEPLLRDANQVTACLDLSSLANKSGYYYWI